MCLCMHECAFACLISFKKDRIPIHNFNYDLVWKAWVYHEYGKVYISILRLCEVLYDSTLQCFHPITIHNIQWTQNGFILVLTCQGVISGSSGIAFVGGKTPVFNECG